MEIVKFEKVEERIIEIREQKVLLDTDVAALYGVETKEINQAVKNNLEKFPSGYIMVLTKDEKLEVVKNFDHLGKVKFSPQLPKAFTEKGLYMLATIIKSEIATQTTIAIVETFAKIKSLSRNIKELIHVKDEQKKQNILQKSGETIAELLEDDMITDASETTIELNFAVLKFKHTIKKKKQNKSK
ncbi:MAG: ORF6N domain-containing protein [Bacteroidia bacterium]